MSTTDTTTTSTARTNRPIDKVRHSNVHASIWRNVDNVGRVWYSTTVERTYTDSKGDWHPTTSFGRDELLVLAQVVNAAYHRIRELQARDRQAARANANAVTGEMAA